MYTFEELDPIIQERLSDPIFQVHIADFIRDQGFTDTSIQKPISDICLSILIEEISIVSGLQKINTLFEIEKDVQNILMTFLMEVFTSEVFDIILKYPSNTPPVPQTERKISLSKSISPTLDNRTISTRLFDALASFSLHVDEQAVVAKEVERYVKGEIRAVDVGAHIAAMIDKPVSTVSKIIESLNEHIFVPLKKQIVEEKAHDLHDSDEALTAALLGKQPKKETGQLSFVPQDLVRTIEQRRKEEIFSDLRSVGGTPSGTSLLSQEIKNEQKINTATNTQTDNQIKIMPKKDYSIDPYREIL